MSRFMRVMQAGAACAFALWLSSCSETPETPVAVPDLSELFADVDDAEIDVESHSIVLPAGTDSFTVDNIAALGGKKCYLALDDDPVDPEIDWDNPVSTGTTLAIGEEGVRIVVLDDANRVVAVWEVRLPEEMSSSSNVTPQSSSSETSVSSSAKSSSSEEIASSSSEQKSSSSVKEESSSSEVPLSSSEVSSSSEEFASSSSTPRNDNTDESSSSEEAPSSSSVVEVQLPGSDFSARNDFWATTSDAMATKKTSAAITVSSEANLAFDGGMATLTTREVEGKFTIIPGGWKMAGGFYFSGTYAGENALDIYEQGYTSGTPSTDCSDITKDMTFGKPFTARPTAFTVKYSYHHEDGKSSDYPQKSLVYVMLVGKDGKVVATGAFSDESSVEMNTRTVNLSYGKDPFGLLSGEYPVADGLTLGKGDEDVTAIHVMFASSAYSHIVCGGTAGNSGKYRGGENSALVLDDFKLVY
ncbi:MAG: PCMD domain-containing protein [Fibrobacter sp.]|nr:PCMD domain-containing protein [Fibrobacter sp.]